MPEREVTIFVDRCVGRGVAERLRRLGSVRVIALEERYPDSVEDAVWLADAGREGWIFLSRDKRLRRQPLQCEAIRTFGVAGVIYTSGNSPGESMSAAIETALRKIVHHALTKRRPWLGTLYSNGKFVVEKVSRSSSRKARRRRTP